MHEKALFEDLMAKIDSVAREQSAQQVTGIVVRLGPFSHLTPDHFMEHFEWESRDSLAAGAKVRFEPWDEANVAEADGIVLESVDVAVKAEQGVD